jgi:hypothetical protein
MVTTGSPGRQGPHQHRWSGRVRPGTGARSTVVAGRGGGSGRACRGKPPRASVAGVNDEPTWSTRHQFQSSPGSTERRRGGGRGWRGGWGRSRSSRFSSSLLDGGGQGRAQGRLVVAGQVQPSVDEQGRGPAGAVGQALSASTWTRCPPSGRPGRPQASTVQPQPVGVARQEVPADGIETTVSTTSSTGGRRRPTTVQRARPAAASGCRSCWVPRRRQYRSIRDGVVARADGSRPLPPPR